MSTVLYLFGPPFENQTCLDHLITRLVSTGIQMVTVYVIRQLPDRQPFLQTTIVQLPTLLSSRDQKKIR